jgi:hypothetical protein
MVNAANSERIELPESKRLLRKLRFLERRRGASGRDRVDHSPAGTMILPMRSPVSLISFSVSGAGYRQPICIQPTSRPTGGRMTRPPRWGLAQVQVGGIGR